MSDEKPDKVGHLSFVDWTLAVMMQQSKADSVTVRRDQLGVLTFEFSAGDRKVTRLLTSSEIRELRPEVQIHRLLVMGKAAGYQLRKRGD